MDKDLFYVAPKESMDLILKNGIFIPNDVIKLIDDGSLDKTVLGVSYGMDSSNFPEYVSLLEDYDIMSMVAEQICFSRTGRYNHPDFMAIGYPIDAVVRSHKEFVTNDIVKKMHPDSYHSEVLYKGKITVEFIGRPFAVRTHKF
jgi:hypothetical protein